jgi:hypothetical protein
LWNKQSDPMDKPRLSCTLGFGGHVQDAVRVEVKGDFDLRYAATRRGRDVSQLKAANGLVMGRHILLTLR